MAFRNNRERRAKTPSSSKVFKYWCQNGKLPYAKNNEFIELKKEPVLRVAYF